MSTTSSARSARRSFLGPNAYAVSVLLFRASVAVAVVAALYLLWGLFSGQLNDYASLARNERARIFSNILLAGTVLRVSVAAAALFGAVIYFEEQVTGYLMAVIALLFYAGVPYAALSYGSSPSVATRHALVAFPGSVLALAVIGGLLVVRDVALQLIEALRNKPLRHDLLQYGGGAQPEAAAALSVKQRFLGKCWQGPFCRDFIRAHCPVFHEKKVCWREKRGCYCEPDIVNRATSRITGVQLSMAPDARYNFANDPTPSPRKNTLSAAQKRLRCHHCVIYNEHQRQKYQLLVPIVISGVALVCLFGSPYLRDYLGAGLAGVEGVMKRFTFGDSSQGFSWLSGRPSPTVEWVFIGALGVMVLSKVLQVLEWAVFKLKI